MCEGASLPYICLVLKELWPVCENCVVFLHNVMKFCVFVRMSVCFRVSSAWPDPSSPLLSAVDFGVSLDEVLGWLHCRDVFLGHNGRQQDISTALLLARDCKHPDAVWLTSLMQGKQVVEARDVFLSSENDARALCFAWWLTDERERYLDLSLLGRAAHLGDGFACATLSKEVLTQQGCDEEAFRLARFAAVRRHERDGFYALGKCHLDRARDCDEEYNLAKENFLFAAHLGHVLAVQDYSHFLGLSTVECWVWLARAAFRGFPSKFLCAFSTQVEYFFTDACGSAAIVCLIGYVLKGNIDEKKKQIFGLDYNFEVRNIAAKQAVTFFELQMQGARLAVHTWSLVALRLGVVKDLRIYIGEMIWDERFEAIYE